jgi:hypothetical protein
VTLHVTNGDSAAGTLRATALGGDVLAWQDVLHEGPLADVADDDLRLLRARFLASHGWGEAESIAAGLRERDETLDAAVREGRPVVLWFEHDLYDQLQLLQVLARLPDVLRGPVELVQSETYLGSLDVADLERLWPTRVPVDGATVVVARAAWTAVLDGRVEDALRLDTRRLPWLAPALRRLLEEREPLPRTRRQLLRALESGPRRPPEAFLASQEQEEAIFLGDEWCFVHLHELVAAGLVAPADGRELPLPPPRGDYDDFASVPLELTEAGRRAVAA